MTLVANDCPVLVAEDDPSIRALIASALRRRRLNLAAVANGEEALQHLQRRHWTVLVLDLMMPLVTGWEVITWLTAHRDKKPKTVIVVSAIERPLLEQLDPSVVNAIIFKPFDIVQLAAYVRRQASCLITTAAAYESLPRHNIDRRFRCPVPPSTRSSWMPRL